MHKAHQSYWFAKVDSVLGRVSYLRRYALRRCCKQRAAKNSVWPSVADLEIFGVFPESLCRAVLVFSSGSLYLALKKSVDGHCSDVFTCEANEDLTHGYIW